MKNFLEYLIESLKVLRYLARSYRTKGDDGRFVNRDPELEENITVYKHKILLLKTLIKTNSTIKSYAEKTGMLEAYLISFIIADVPLSSREYDKIKLVAKWHGILDSNVRGAIRITFKKDLEQYLRYYYEHHPDEQKRSELIFVEPVLKTG